MTLASRGFLYRVKRAISLAQKPRSNRNPLDLIARNLVLPAVVELGRPRAHVICDVLRGFRRALVFQIRDEAGRAEGTVPDPRLDASAACPPLGHAVHVGPDLP